MDDTQRSQVLDNAKYLREVRPIDPEEIHEYVEGQPHPAAVRQVLRESALDLGLIEREDGRFEPAPTDPIDVSFGGITALPQDIALAVEEQLLDAFGPGWPDGTSGDRLRATIRDFKQQYLSGGEVTYDDVTALGYAIYHLPTYFAATQHVLADLAADGLVSGNLRILDVGAGVGGPALAVDALLPDEALVEYHAVEPSDAADVLDALLDETGQNFHPTIHRDPIETVGVDGEFDLILCANVLSELDDPEAVLLDLMDHLADDGTLCALAPADRNTATDLRDLERTVESEADATIYAPTVRLWPHERPDSTSWSFDRKPDLEVPAFQRRLDEGERNSELDTDSDRVPGDGEFVNVDVQYAYSLLRTDGQRALDIDLSGGRFAKMAETERHVTDRIDCAGIKLSHDLSDGGNPLFLIGDGSEQIDHFAVLTEESLLNEDLRAADYGDFLQIENVLVLWNDDEGAYNLVVDGETVVEGLPG
ncbi:small ribosomal subunit Rsm22 family protein [Halovenus sp. HT40]|uniref:small ribosomal subunit Rsm22 family protein n=1 Tax=Halovenus sp. HT40 TaxID=3126691 RepID=UPI00300F6D2C